MVNIIDCVATITNAAIEVKRVFLVVYVCVWLKVLTQISIVITSKDIEP